MKAIVASFVIAALSLYLVACSSQQSADGNRQEQGAKQEKPNAPPEQSAPTQRQPLASMKIYRGRIGDRPIEMKLNRDGEHVYGTYSYDAIGQDLKVDGRIDAQGNLTLTEFDASGKQTGKFVCRYEKPEPRDADIECDWTRPNGSGQTYAALNEQHVEFTNGLRLIPKVITDRKYGVNASYPQIIGDSGALTPSVAHFNHKVADIVSRSVKEFRQNDLVPGKMSYSANYTVLLATNDLVSVEIVEDSYAGGAHPTTGYYALTYDLRADKELQLADLFKPNSGYEKAIRRYSLKDINKRAEKMDQEEAQREGNKQQKRAEPVISEDALADISAWAMTPKGLMIYFDFPHVIAAFDRTFVPYSVIKDFLKPDGPATVFAAAEYQ